MFRRHVRFLIALVLGILAGTAMVGHPLPFRALVAIDVFSAVFLGMMGWLAFRMTPNDLQRHWKDADEGIGVIMVIAIVVVALSLALVIGLLGSARKATHVEIALAVAGIPLAWAMLQTLLAFHYGRHFYGGMGDGGGIKFEDTAEPGIWDFLYFSFTVGMTAQVSDSVVTSREVRRIVLGHGVLSFFYNTVILALAVNAGVSMVG